MLPPAVTITSVEMVEVAGRGQTLGQLAHAVQELVHLAEVVAVEVQDALVALHADEADAV